MTTTALHILGMGHSYPPTQLDNNFLSGLNKELDKEWLNSQLGIRSRTSVLPLDYIRSSGNKDHKQGQSMAVKSPTDLSVEAAQMALARAGITAEQLGLILAECSTPVETTPFESQRLGKRLNVKIPAFDVFSGSGALSLYLDLMQHRNAQACPEYTLCVSSNTPTQRVYYGSGLSGACFGDAACAMVISGRHRGKLRVAASKFRTDPFAEQAYWVETYGSAHISQQVIETELVDQTKCLFREACQELALKPAELKIALNLPSPKLANKVLQDLDIPLQSLVENVSERGFSFGSTCASALAEHWPTLTSADRILVLECSGNLGQGYTLLEAQDQ